ncbi:hypothetical protein BD309DRAFT_988333 [Dichomitus squalens]|uniref:Uncharacterized protein n=1 Tax=Dichomitus squalens TaxID=114155 RepID=A0A4Q9Q2K4_9APHY|nr:hypothetical protein BD309DRAFT_988333 [Dichomitus squalens]TBU60804.1 hypothetical protein BD310DRAFT_1000453 [Dichomitus squalens]
MAHACFLYKSIMYVCGGQRSGTFELCGNTKQLSNYTAGIAKGNPYVFGGKFKRAIGCNLFAALNIAKKTWTQWSGTTDTEALPAQYDVPDPRKQHAISTTGGRAVQNGVRIIRGLRAYDDCWSWDIAKRESHRERVSGNFPCPHAEMSVFYYPNVNSTIMFGGHNPALPYYSSSTPRFRHVLTPSFPTYRALG